MACPSCKRPVATSGPNCLYCGAALPLESVAPSSAAEAARETASELHSLVLVDSASLDPTGLGQALEIAAFEALQRARRGGFFPWRVLPPEPAEAAVSRLEALGIRALALPMRDVQERGRPLVILGGRRGLSTLALRSRDGLREVSPQEVALIVKGAITREYAPTDAIRRVRLATLEPGFRIHVHLRGETRPLELDPGSFDFSGATLGRSSLLTLLEWVGEVLPGAPHDDAFRYETPALAPAPREEAGPTGAASALVTAPRGKGEVVPYLDNLGQFRFYSAWRGAAEARTRSH